MTTFNQITFPIKDHLDNFEPFFREAVVSNIPMLDKILHYIIRRKGKQMRPIMIFLSAGLCGNISEKSYHGALTIELIHSATLVHDDVVDDSFQRRGAFSINALWRNKISVLVGDFILGKGLTWCIEHKEYKFLELISETVSAMSEGEIIQIDKARKLDITREVYFDIIEKKTASLLACSAAIGAASTTDDDDTINELKQFGKDLGIAFQIKDDVLDYQNSNIIGKPTGNDLRERKVTLPLIYALEKSSTKEQKAILRKLRKKKKNSKDISELTEFVITNGGLQHANEQMNIFTERAHARLMKFPKTEYRDALEHYIEFVTTRNK
ncbi:polyprenyl synthetase family protein [Halosquirtibacter xylanolyticus]|uniref:polyprenyl synthetase family protein n=1 Tax=Halosquirtibacter xylanolyticus TaxID=3374599 RepID=UPI0037497B20|nr:polyprenyl synthetase family protein [Prolixibacteraceae bacterium]